MKKDVILINTIVYRGAIILAHKGLRKTKKIFINGIYSKPPKKIMLLTKQMLIVLITFGV